MQKQKVQEGPELRELTEKLADLRGAGKGKMGFTTFDDWHHWRSTKGSQEFSESLDKRFAAKK